MTMTTNTNMTMVETDTNIVIKGIAHYVPETIVSNQQIIDRHSLRIKASWIENRIGITERRWADENIAASDLAVKAVEKLKLVDFKGSIWVSTISQDYLTPSTASIIKQKLGITDKYPAIDLNAACAGQIFGLEMAKSRLEASDEEEALVIATEVRSRFLNKKDRRTAFLFGDGACAIHLKKEPREKSGGKINSLSTLTIPSDFFEILVPGGGSVSPVREPSDLDSVYIKMRDGERIVQLTTGNLLDIIREHMEKNRQTIDEFDFFVFHQGNGAIINSICNNLNISLSKTWINFNKFGNTSSASMGIALSEAHQQEKIKKGDKVMIMAMGAGLHVGIGSLTWGI